MCFPALRRRRRNNKKRTNTMNLFGGSNRDSLGVLKGFVGMTTTLASPHAGPFHTRRRGFGASFHHKSGGDRDASGGDGSRGFGLGSDAAAAAAVDRDEEALQEILHMRYPLRIKLEHTYDRLRRRRHLLTRDEFAAFLRDVQGEDPDEVERLLPPDKEEYERHEFLETWFFGFGWDATRPVRLEDKDLSKPITNYFINSSHNTYLVGHQWMSRADPRAYKRVLERGCRCIEIDVWNGDTPSPNTPNRSASPNPVHRRQISGNSIPNMTASVKDTVGETIDAARSILSEKLHGPSSHRNSVSSARDLSLSPREEGLPAGANGGLNPQDSSDRLDSPRATSRNRSRTRSSYPRSEPIVTHGWTAVVPCGFREVCQAVRESAFVNNDLPLVISLEVHTDHEQQEVMVQIMKEEWGDLLLQQSIDGLDPRFRLPTLGELRNKILVKVKKPPHKTEVGTAGSSLAIHSTIQDEDCSGSEDERALAPPGVTVVQRRARKVSICQALGALAIYTHSEHFRSFDGPAAKKPSHVFSISESKILELHTSKHSELFVHNKGFFMRAFPNGIRFDSSNLDPSLFWRKGVQMVAMNWQSLDEGMMLNDAMFADERGWVLKPPGYRSADRECATQAAAAPHRTLDLVVRVLAGQHAIDPQAVEGGDDSRAMRRRRPVVKCELHVERPEERTGKMIEGGGWAREGEYKKATPQFKGDQPDFGDEGFPLVFLNIPYVVEELSFIRFKVQEDSSVGRGKLAWACIRLDRLRPGYRFIRLNDVKRGDPIEGGKLLVKIEKTLR